MKQLKNISHEPCVCLPNNHKNVLMYYAFFFGLIHIKFIFKNMKYFVCAVDCSVSICFYYLKTSWTRLRNDTVTNKSICTFIYLYVNIRVSLFYCKKDKTENECTNNRYSHRYVHIFFLLDQCVFNDYIPT